jgi:hypothetical protein
VELAFDNTLTNLAGYDYGISIYNNQVDGKLDLNTSFEIVFPTQIRGVASSFVQGFFEKIVDTIGLLQTEKNAVIISDKQGFSEMVMSKLQ